MRARWKVLALFALAVGIRALPWREVFALETVQPFDNDAYYHLRRIVYSAVHFPAVLGFDPYLNFPTGAAPIWSPGFDWSLAAAARSIHGELRAGEVGELERWLMWVPPLLGAAGVVAAMGLARRQFGRTEGLLAAALLCVLPAHFWYTQIGFLDHHAAVAWLSTVLASAATALHAARAGAPSRMARLACGFGALIAIALAVWPGTLLHLVFLEVGLAAALLAEPSRSAARRELAALAGAHAVAAIAIAPLAWGNVWPQWSNTSPLVLSRFQPAGLGAAALAAGLCTGLWGCGALGATRARRGATLAAVAALAVGAAGLAAPSLVGEIGNALGWLLRRDGFQVLVAESVPLLEVDGRFSFAVAWQRFGPFVALYPPALVAIAWGAPRRPERWIFVAWAAGLFAATLLQRRFFDTASVGFAIALAAAVCAAWRWASARERAAPARAAVAAAAALAIAPLGSTYVRYMGNEWRALHGEPLRANAGFGVARAGTEVADWLRWNTPRTHGWLDPDRRPEYGVLAPWPLGHLIQYRARRPTPIDNFGDDLGADGFAWARRVERAREAEIVGEMEARAIRYVVAEGRARLSAGPLRRGTLAHSLFFLDGSGQAASGSDAAVPALTQHRLVFESRGVDFTDPRAPALYKVFEVVAGAVVVGRSAPGAAIDAALGVRTPRGRVFRYEASAVADPDGRYRLRLPYATSGGPPSTAVEPHYQLRCGGRSEPLAVEEDAVREGRQLVGPTLCGEELTRRRAAADGSRSGIGRAPREPE